MHLQSAMKLNYIHFVFYTVCNTNKWARGSIIMS